MKKKIKDLTIKDTIKICTNQEDCYGCPLVHVCALLPTQLISQHKEELEKEIEL